jgi:ABC-type glycerol-3-phosphate transport system substrate-binding protein
LTPLGCPIIPRGAKSPEGALDFIKFWSGFTDPEQAAKFHNWGGWLPMFPEVAAAPDYQAYIEKFPQFKTFLDLLPSENLIPMPPVTFQPLIGIVMQRTEDSLMRGSMTPEEAMDFFEFEIRKELARIERLRGK